MRVPDPLKSLKGYRTVAYNVVSGVLGSGFIAILLATNWQVLGFSAAHAGWIMLVLKIIDHAANIWLRAVTDTPMGKKG